MVALDVLSGSNTPPPFDVQMPVPLVTVVLVNITGAFAQTVVVLTVPTEDVGNGVIVTVKISCTFVVPHTPFPVAVRVKVAIPEAMSVALNE